MKVWNLHLLSEHPLSGDDVTGLTWLSSSSAPLRGGVLSAGRGRAGRTDGGAGSGLGPFGSGSDGLGGDDVEFIQVILGELLLVSKGIIVGG